MTAPACGHQVGWLRCELDPDHPGNTHQLSDEVGGSTILHIWPAPPARILDKGPEIVRGYAWSPGWPVLDTVVELRTSILRLLAIHGCIVLARKHPQLPEGTAALVDEVLDNLETLFTEIGLVEPDVGGGWRGDSP